MRTQLQAVGLRMQTLRSNQQMAEAMRGATRVHTAIYLFSHRTECRLLLGNGFDESWTQSSSDNQDHERL